MEFTNEFRVPSDLDTTFATLTDLEKVAPCLPGAVLEEVDGDTYHGRVKVKVGPMQVTYRGTARIAEKDDAAKRGRIEASGKETRGTGTAAADVVATLQPDGDGTRVTVTTDLNVTGKPAQFGRGVMAEVGTRIIDAFADRLRTMLEDGEREPDGSDASEAGAATSAASSDEGETASGGEALATGAATVGRRQLEQDPSRDDDALDLLEVAGSATAKRLAPLVAVLAVALGVLWWLRRR